MKVKDDKVVLSIIEDKIMINETLSKLIKIDIFSEEKKMKLPVTLFFNVGLILFKVDFIHVTINCVYIKNLRGQCYEGFNFTVTNKISACFSLLSIFCIANNRWLSLIIYLLFFNNISFPLPEAWLEPSILCLWTQWYTTVLLGHN